MSLNRLLYIIAALVFGLGLTSCHDVNSDKVTSEEMKPGSTSDNKAIQLAKMVLEANGGQRAWDNTKYLAWTFFDSRRLLWDKHNNKVRIKSMRDDYEAVVDLRDTSGIVFYRGELQTHSDSLKKYLERAYRIWINDSYWLVLPFKLLDSGVTLKYLGQGTSETGIQSEIIELTFENVGVTPNNKYHVWIDKSSNLIIQWAYYTNAEDEDPRFINAWDGYEQYGQIQLSSGRGANRSLDDIKVLKEVKNAAFETLDPYSF